MVCEERLGDCGYCLERRQAMWKKVCQTCGEYVHACSKCLSNFLQRICLDCLVKAQRLRCECCHRILVHNKDQEIVCLRCKNFNCEECNWQGRKIEGIQHGI
jgi:hypothetical protein